MQHCTEICISQIKMNYWKNRENSIKSKVLNWQPDILFRKKVEFEKTVSLWPFQLSILQMPACEKMQCYFCMHTSSGSKTVTFFAFWNLTAFLSSWKLTVSQNFSNSLYNNDLEVKNLRKMWSLSGGYILLSSVQRSGK